MNLIIELGGTNARFALCCSLSRPLLECIRVISCNHFESVNDAIAWYLSETSLSTIDSVCLAIAGPAKGPVYRLTNSAWSLEINSVRQIAKTKEVKVVNDFAALAAYVRYIADDELLSLRQGCPDIAGPKLVLGPGTGMGMAVLVPFDESWRVLSSEGGNIGFSPTTPLEIEIFKLLHKRFGRIVIEDLLSGNGLVLIHNTLCNIRDCSPQPFSAAQITQLALTESNPICMDTVNTFFGILGEYASDMALAVCASGGVYLGGGILPRIVSTLAISIFCKRFTSKRKLSGFITDIPVWLITAEYPALIGACHLLREELNAQLIPKK